MSQIVRCDVCGGVYNQRYLRAHMRLSHRNSESATPSGNGELKILAAIMSMYTQLSDESKKTLRDRLANAGDETP
jgi:hypothetical protein